MPDHAPTPPTASPAVAPSAPIAVAARAFGDDYPPVAGQRTVRVAGVVLIAATVLYLPWMLTSLNHGIPWLTWPFAVANVFTLAAGVLAVANAWWRVVPSSCAPTSNAAPLSHRFWRPVEQ